MMSTVTTKGQVTLPKVLREKLSIKKGDEVVFELDGNSIRLSKVKKKSVLSLGGIAKGRAIGKGNERKYTKHMVSKKIAESTLRDE